MRLIVFIALRQLWSRRLLNGIAVLGVALGVLVLVWMNAILEGFQMKFKGELLKVSPHVTLFDKELGGPRTLLEQLVPGALAASVAHDQPSDRVTRVKRPREWIRALEAMPEVAAACGTVAGQALVSRGTQDLGIDLRGVVPEEQERCTPLSSYVLQGSWSALSAGNDAIALGSGIADAVGARLGDRLRVVAPGGRPVSLRVAAIYEAGIPAVDKTRAYVALSTAQSILRRPDVIGRIEIRLRDPSGAVEFARTLRAMTGNEALSWQELSANFLSLFDLQRMIVRMVIAAILTVSGFGILAIQIMIVLQKTRDIAILRSMGLRRADILLGFLLQGFIIAIVGGVIGDLAGWRLTEFLVHVPFKSEGMVKSTHYLIHQDPLFYLWGVLFALVVGMVASFIPAWRGSRVEPVEVLRGQLG